MLSPLNQRRLAYFKANKRGYCAFWIFSVLFVLSLAAELIANDKPILLRFNGEFYIPILSFHPETTFGGDFATEADYRDPYVIGLIEEKGKGWMIWPPIRYSYQTINYHLPEAAPTPPSAENWLGTDDQGRDVAARVIYGFRISLWFGLILTFFSAIIGISVGAVQGYFGGLLDLITQRIIEIWNTLPILFLVMILTSFMAASFGWLLSIMVLFGWLPLVGVVRAECLKTRNMDYVRAARALGVKERNIVFFHVLPNSIVATMTFLPFILNGSITTLTALDFLGFGMPAGSPSLGELLAQGKANLQAPWLGITGFTVIAIMLSLLIFIGEAVRDALDPRKT